MSCDVGREDAQLAEKVGKDTQDSAVIGTADLNDVHCWNAERQS